jgi:hypothetical protein
MREFSLRYRPSDRVLFAGCTSVPARYYYRKPLFDEKSYCLDLPTLADMNIDRFWLIYNSTWPGTKTLVSIAKQSHDLAYWFPAPDGTYLQEALFERRKLR